MESQTSQQTVIDPQHLQQLQDEVQQEMRESLNKANFRKILEKYGISTQEFMKFQCVLDLTKLQPAPEGLLPSKRVTLSVCTCWSMDEDRLVNCPCH